MTNEEEMLWAMKLITDSVLPGRWENTRVPPSRAEIASTSIWRVKVVSGGGKIRDGGPAYNDKDTKREDVVGIVWTGFVPIWEAFGEPVFGGKGRLAEPSAHVTALVRKGNEKGDKGGDNVHRGQAAKRRVFRGRVNGEFLSG